MSINFTLYVSSVQEYSFPDGDGDVFTEQIAVVELGNRSQLRSLIPSEETEDCSNVFGNLVVEPDDIVRWLESASIERGIPYHTWGPAISLVRSLKAGLKQNEHEYSTKYCKFSYRFEITWG